MFPHHQNTPPRRERELEVSLYVSRFLKHITVILTSIWESDCGIRPSTQQEAEWLQDYVRKSNNKAQADGSSRMPGKSGDEGGSDGEDDDDSSDGNVPKRQSLTINGGKSMPGIDPSDKTPTAKSIISTQAPRQATSFGSTRIRRSVGPEVTLGPTPHPTVPTTAPPSYLAHRALSVRNLPNFPSIDEAVGTSSTTQGMAAREVWGWFEAHLDQLLDSFRTYRFDQFEMHLRTFWQNLTGEYREVVHAPAIAGLMAKADAILYDVGLRLRLQVSVDPNFCCRRCWKLSSRRCFLPFRRSL